MHQVSGERLPLTEGEQTNSAQLPVDEKRGLNLRDWIDERDIELDIVKAIQVVQDAHNLPVHVRGGPTLPVVARRVGFVDNGQAVTIQPEVQTTVQACTLYIWILR